MQSNENKEILLEDAIKCNTTKTLTKFMRSSQEYYNDAIEFFSNAKSVELLRENFSVLINDQKFNIAYKFIYLKAILKAVGNSMKELIIVECPCPCCLDSVLYHIIRGEKELRQIIVLDNIPEKHEAWIRRHTDAKVIFPITKLSVKLRQIIVLDNIPEKHEAWIRRHTDAKVIFPITKLSKLIKSFSKKTLVIDSVDFSSLLIPFKDLAFFESIKTLKIDGNFKELDLTVDNIQKFVNFINEFPKLHSIDISFSLSSTKADGLDGFGFYYNMKQIERKMFNGLSLNLKGTIHFGATVNHFENMSGSMQMDIEILSKKAANAITYDIENSVVERKIKIYEGLSIEFKD
uniref:Uncharacterized protein n=1 Tax=Panagrolaimus davidi TaxID=227884 RepID=A0A914QIF0_9BILA